MSHNEQRTRYGFPILSGNSNSPITASFRRFVDRSSNKPLPWIAFSWFLSGGAVLGLLIWSIVAPSLIDSRVEARVARAEALAELARKEASTAKDIVDLEVQRRKAREEIQR